VKRSPSKPAASTGPGRSLVAVAIGVAAGLLVVVPLPYFIIAPGHAIDLGTRVTVEGRAVSHARFFLTDVTVARATPLGLLARFLPATDVVPSDAVMPAGESADAFDRSMDDAMSESQNVAGFVAERAAGLPVRDDFIVRVVGFPAQSFAANVLRANDRIVRIDGRAIGGNRDIARAIAARAATATSVRVTIEREGTQRTVNVRPMRVSSGGRRLGVFVSARLPAPDLPVPVRFSVNDVSGSSAGLMFALQIYADLHALPVSGSIAGTGTIASDGTVGPIEGTRQKLEAARRAGARVFFVPRANARDIANESGHDLAIVPVGRFQDALAYLESNAAIR
jgi:PDZ domain-containing protein